MRGIVQVWEKKLPVRKPSGIQALMVLVNRGMTVGTYQMVTAISMVKNDEIDSLSPFTKRVSRIILGSYPVSKPWVKKLYVDSVRNSMMWPLESDLQGRENLSYSNFAYATLTT